MAQRGLRVIFVPCSEVAVSHPARMIKRRQLELKNVLSRFGPQVPPQKFF